MSELSDFQKQAAISGLKHMLYESNHFSICEFDKLATLLGQQPGGKDYQALSLIHCHHWGDMEPAFREHVRGVIVGLLNVPLPPEQTIDVDAVSLPKNTLRSLFGRSQ